MALMREMRNAAANALAEFPRRDRDAFTATEWVGHAVAACIDLAVILAVRAGTDRDVFLRQVDEHFRRVTARDGGDAN